MELILITSCDMNTTVWDGETALKNGQNWRCSNVHWFLKKHGIKLNAGDDYGSTVLHYACFNCSRNVKVLLENQEEFKPTLVKPHQGNYSKVSIWPTYLTNLWRFEICCCNMESLISTYIFRNSPQNFIPIFLRFVTFSKYYRTWSSINCENLPLFLKSWLIIHFIP